MSDARAVALLLVVATVLGGCTLPETSLAPTWRVVEVLAPTDCDDLGYHDRCVLLELEATADSEGGWWAAVSTDGSTLFVREASLAMGPVEAGSRRRLIIEDVPPDGVSHLTYERFGADGSMRIALGQAARTAEVEPFEVRDVRVVADPEACEHAEDEACFLILGEVVKPWGSFGFLETDAVVASDGTIHDVRSLATEEVKATLVVPLGVEPALLLLEIWPRERPLTVALGAAPPRATKPGAVVASLVEARPHASCPEASFGWTCVAFEIAVENGLDEPLRFYAADSRSSSGFVHQATLSTTAAIAAGYSGKVRGETVIAGGSAEVRLREDVPAVSIDLGAVPDPLDEPFADDRFRIEGWNVSQACLPSPCLRVDVRLQRPEYGGIVTPLVLDPLGAVVGPSGELPQGYFEPPTDVRYTLTYPWRGEGEPRFMAALDRPIAPSGWIEEAPLAGTAPPAYPWPLELSVRSNETRIREEHVETRTIDVTVRSRATAILPLVAWWVALDEMSYTFQGGEWNVTTTDGARWVLAQEQVVGLAPGGEATVRLSVDAPAESRIASISFAGVTLELEEAPPPPETVEVATLTLVRASAEPIGPGIVRLHLDHRVSAARERTESYAPLLTADGATHIATVAAGPPGVAPGETGAYHSHFTLPSWVRPAALRWADREVPLPEIGVESPPEGPLAVWVLPACPDDALCLRIAFAASQEEDFFTDIDARVATASGRTFQAKPVVSPEAYAAGSWGIVDVELPSGEEPATFWAFQLRDETPLPPRSAWRDA